MAAERDVSVTAGRCRRSFEEAMRRGNRSQACLLCRQGSDDGKPEGSTLRGGVHQERPQAEAAQHEQQVNRRLDEEEDSLGDCTDNQPQNGPCNPKSDPCEVEEQRLEGVEADEAVALVRINDEKQDGRDDSGNIGQGSGSVDAHAGRRGRDRNGDGLIG
jgi:hypothetical protein